jgi:hypothetical protein
MIKRGDRKNERKRMGKKIQDLRLKKQDFKE